MGWRQHRCRWGSRFRCALSERVDMFREHGVWLGLNAVPCFAPRRFRIPTLSEYLVMAFCWLGLARHLVEGWSSRHHLNHYRSPSSMSDSHREQSSAALDTATLRRRASASASVYPFSFDVGDLQDALVRMEGAGAGGSANKRRRLCSAPEDAEAHFLQPEASQTTATTAGAAAATPGSAVSTAVAATDLGGALPSGKAASALHVLDVPTHLLSRILPRAVSPPAGSHAAAATDTGGTTTTGDDASVGPSGGGGGSLSSAPMPPRNVRAVPDRHSLLLAVSSGPHVGVLRLLLSAAADNACDAAASEVAAGGPSHDGAGDCAAGSDSVRAAAAAATDASVSSPVGTQRRMDVAAAALAAKLDERTFRPGQSRYSRDIRGLVTIQVVDLEVLSSGAFPAS
eukprot:XP_001700996.1 predicted protein [Chlamydomonas reinhardtii]